jgi:ArsR family transcriptional regulator
MCDIAASLRDIDGGRYEIMQTTSTRVNMTLVETIATLTASCPPLLDGRLDEGDAVRLAAALRVLAEPARLRLLSLIHAQPDAEACVCHLTEPLGLSQPTVSHHLKVLRESGWVRTERRGSYIWYWLRPEALDRFGRIAGELIPIGTVHAARALPVLQPNG